MIKNTTQDILITYPCNSSTAQLLMCYCYACLCHSTSIGTVTGQLKNHGSTYSRGKRYFSSLKCQDWLWDLLSLLFSTLQEGSSFSRITAAGDGKLATHLYIVPRLRMRETIHPLSHIPWRVMFNSAQEQFTINLYTNTYLNVYCPTYKKRVHRAHSVLENVRVVWILRFSYCEC